MVVCVDKVIDVPETTAPTALEAKIMESNKRDKHLAFNIWTILVLYSWVVGVFEVFTCSVWRVLTL